MSLKFAGYMPFSSGTAKTKEERDRTVEGLVAGKWNVKTTDRLGAVNDLVIMRRNAAGFEWRIYEIPAKDVLLYATVAEEVKVLEAERFEVSVVTTGTQLSRGHAYSRPIEWPYKKHVETATIAKAAFRSWMENRPGRVAAP